MEERNEIIKQLRSQGLTYKKIGERYSLTGERVRQIVSGGKKYDRILLFRELRSKYGNKQLLKDIKRLSSAKKTAALVAERNQLIRYLRDELGLPFLQIAVLLHRDHTTIQHSYNYAGGERFQVAQ
jgi:hypothetical protein